MTNPKLRPVEAHWIEHRGQPALLVRDPLGLSDQALLLPPALATLLSLCDGTRNAATLRSVLVTRAGVDISADQLEHLLAQLDEALLLVSPRFKEACNSALAVFRSAPCRPPSLAGRGYPADATELRRALDGYVAEAFKGGAQAMPAGNDVTGVISPHIDYQRGGPIYASAWQPLVATAKAADVVIIFGTDHSGGPGELTFTRQHYSTPLGLLPTDQGVVDAVAVALGEEDAFGAELNHRHEHSIELASVWLQYVLGDHRCTLVPILCGSFQPFTDLLSNPANNVRFAKTLEALRQATAGRRVLVVAAADLAHVGPAFGDQKPLDALERDALRQADEAVLAAAISGDAGKFFAPIQAERDRRRVCGLPPIYMMLRFLEAARGEVTGYAQCPADEEGGSLVSIAGVVYRGSQVTEDC